MPCLNTSFLWFSWICRVPPKIDWIDWWSRRDKKSCSCIQSVLYEDSGGRLRLSCWPLYSHVCMISLLYCFSRLACLLFDWFISAIVGQSLSSCSWCQYFKSFWKKFRLWTLSQVILSSILDSSFSPCYVKILMNLNTRHVPLSLDLIFLLSTRS